jgi:hypothetical protein
MSYVGNTPISAAFLTDTFSGNGSTTVFTMTVAPANTSSIIVAVTGVLQDPSTYSVSGTTLTFSGAPPSGTSNISVRYLGIPASGVTTTAYRTVTDTTATAGQTSFSVPSYTVGYIDVFRNGVRLAAADFTATTGTTVVLANSCTVGDTVTTESFYVSSVLNAIPAIAGSVLDAYISGVSASKLTGSVADANIAAVSASKLTGSRTIPKGTMPAGTVLQVVSAFKNDGFSSASTTFVDVTGLSVSITPTSATSTIFILVTSNVSNNTGNAPPIFNLLRNSTNIATPATAPTYNGTVTPYVAGNISDQSAPWSASFLDSPATTSATTYKVQGRGSAGTFYVNRRATADFNSTSTITVMEIAA